MPQSNINIDWKANAQANAAALSTSYEYIAGTYGPIPAIKHMKACVTDPVILAQHISEALEVRFQKDIINV